jgi:hypothetical protein
MMTRIPGHVWLEVDSLPATFGAVWVDKAGRVFVLLHWRVVWAALRWVIAEALAWLECWLTLERARGRGWQTGPRQLRLIA